VVFGFSKQGWVDYCKWTQKDKKVIRRIHRLIDDIVRSPHSLEGIGHPERLRALRGDSYSRRITEEHRLLYKIVDEALIITQCRGHY
jgi:toxin YoeB